MQLYKVRITVIGDLQAVPHSWMNFWNYSGAEGRKITLPYTFQCIVKADSEQDAEKRCMNSRALRMVYRTHYFDYSVTGISEVEEGKDVPLEERIKMLRKKFRVLEE